MPAKVFISCGQANDEERTISQELYDWFEAKGYKPYVATQVPTIPEINTGILSELKSSDYYLFINFERETVNPHGTGSPFRRGSMYTNQELAVAVAFGFDQLILLNQKTVRREGILHYMGVNTTPFDSIRDVLRTVQEVVSTARWENTFSRHLIVENIWIDPTPTPYGDQTTFDPYTGVISPRLSNIGHIEVSNARPDIAAINCAMRLVSIELTGSGKKQGSPDQGRLKATARSEYDQAIWPKSTGSFDLFGIHANQFPKTYLHSELDVRPPSADRPLPEDGQRQPASAADEGICGLRPDHAKHSSDGPLL
jgi:hypothetical protein